MGVLSMDLIGRNALLEQVIPRPKRSKVGSQGRQPWVHLLETSLRMNLRLSTSASLSGLDQIVRPVWLDS